MKALNPIVIAAASVGLLAVPALAQRQAPTPEQRIERLERQVQQVQRQVFPKGRPADTAGFSDEPAATQSSVVTLDQRLDSLERQMSDLLRQSEENGHQLQSLQAELGKLRTDEEARIAAVEQRLAEAAAAAAATAQPPVATTAPPTTTQRPKPQAGGDTPAAGPAGDPGEDAYTAGFRAFDAGQYDQAIASLRSFVSAYPKHRRVSYANNLIGRALIAQGKFQEAASVLLGNYRSNPRGERAADSLYYLGQAEMRLGQPGQACKAYGELDAVYGSKVRADLRKQVDQAKSEAQCS